MIPLDKCIKWIVYRLNSRNLKYGVFNGVDGFIGIREKFGNEFLFTEYHKDYDGPFGTATPLEMVSVVPPEIFGTGEHLSHENGNDWTKKADGLFYPSVRRPLREGEPQHGNRVGFVDEWADTGERLTDDEWPQYRENEALFNFLSEIEKNPPKP